MSAELLLREFERLSEAPDAVARLRRFVLDLALRGKLVEQREDDAPAKELVQFQRNTTEDTGAPAGWVRVRIGDILEIKYGKELPAGHRLTSGPVRVFGSNGVVGYCTEALCEQPAIIVGRKGSAGALNISDGPSWTTDVAYFVVPPPFLALRFLLLALQSLDLALLGKGIKPGLSREDAYALELPVPPPQEQRRIVKKVDELMALCDRLEAAQAERERRRSVVSLASIRQIAQNNNPADVAEAVNSYAINFLPLAVNSDHIESLRSAILRAAATGALKTEPSADPGRAYVSAPWPTQRLDQVAEQIVDCPHSTPMWTTAGKICVRTNQFRPGHLDLTAVRHVSETTYRERIQRIKPRADDILYSREGGILGVACRVPRDVDICLGQRMMLIRASNVIDPKFLEMILNSPPITALAKTATTGGAAPRVNVATVRSYPIPVPPLQEQREVMAKVDGLMALCNALQMQMGLAQGLRMQTFQAILSQALDSA